MLRKGVDQAYEKCSELRRRLAVKFDQDLSQRPRAVPGQEVVDALCDEVLERTGACIRVSESLYGLSLNVRIGIIGGRQ
jgi:hypothetical protein